MFLKAVDYNPSGSKIPAFFECLRIGPQLGEDGRSWLRLERQEDSVSIELLPGFTYYVLNGEGRTIDTIKLREEGGSTNV